MKIQHYKSDEFIRNIGGQKELKGVVIYGPDSGLVSVRSKAIENSLNKTVGEHLTMKIYASQAKENPSIIYDEFVSVSMFGDKKIIVLKEFTDTLSKTLESLEELGSDHFLVVEADNLDTKSKVRSFAEKSKYFAAIPCYVDDENSIKQIITSKFAELGVKYDNEIPNLLASNFGGNRLIVMNEIEKLATFAGDDKYVTAEHFKQCTQDVSISQIDELVNSVAGLDIDKAHRMLVKLFSENINFIVIVRALINYFSKLQLVKSLIFEGASYEEAIKELRPPLFFKQAPVFTHHINLWKLKNLNLFLDRLHLTETKCKSLKLNPNLVVSDFINHSIVYFRKENKAK